ncbi:MAG: InlB B-repeat-containing protein [Lachnospiraceae bacterium]|nr:InlB B-repeat-containing protein [Lachnospiraceae bacterium]
MAENETKESVPERKTQKPAAPDAVGRPLRGLYGKVNISVKTLNIVIIVLASALILSMAFGIANRGFVVEFDSLGGTAVESQKRMYDELVEEPKAPTREGYVFDGWYLDRETIRPWNMETDVVTGPMTLYAGWRAP